ncbi:MAG: helix-hairpin-helix domain-containing protein [Bacteroidales bacterium]|nr:helix-hairpin-helix domain-containing protein [Bacteroidales bacterium]
MNKKKHRLTQLQLGGIIWIAVVLIVILAIKLFSSERAVAVPETDSIRHREQAFLEKMEDSVYRSHRPDYSGRQYPRRAPQNTPRQPDEAPRSWYASEPPAPTRRALTVELNSADTTTLQLLHGIGPASARRIVRYRDRLGGFVSTDQLLEVYGFTPELLAHIAPHLALDSANHSRIPVNSIPLKQFIKHPYVDYYFARDLVNLRSRGVTFSSPDDLRAIPSCTDTMLAKLLPYLDLSTAQ